MGKYKNYHYPPIWDERIFNEVAADADPVLIERRNADICRKRKETYRKILNLRNKPRLSAAEEIALAELEKEYKKLMHCGENNL